MHHGFHADLQGSGLCHQLCLRCSKGCKICRSDRDSGRATSQSLSWVREIEPAIQMAGWARLLSRHLFWPSGAQVVYSSAVKLGSNRLTVFCILVAICRVRSAVVPPAPQVMSQKVGLRAAILSCLIKRLSTPCNNQSCPACLSERE